MQLELEKRPTKGRSESIYNATVIDKVFSIYNRGSGVPRQTSAFRFRHEKSSRKGGPVEGLFEEEGMQGYSRIVAACRVVLDSLEDPGYQGIPGGVYYHWRPYSISCLSLSSVFHHCTFLSITKPPSRYVGQYYGSGHCSGPRS